jgi:hypothetical protein
MATRGEVATGLSATSPRSFLAVGFPLPSLARLRIPQFVKLSCRVIEMYPVEGLLKDLFFNY